MAIAAIIANKDGLLAVIGLAASLHHLAIPFRMLEWPFLRGEYDCPDPGDEDKVEECDDQLEYPFDDQPYPIKDPKEEGPKASVAFFVVNRSHHLGCHIGRPTFLTVHDPSSGFTLALSKAFRTTLTKCFRAGQLPELIR